MISKVKQTSDSAVQADYTWLADWPKLEVTGADGRGYVYLGSLVYNADGGNYSLESAGFSDGRIKVTNSTQEVNYHITDHLGSVRVVVDNKGMVKERNDYYPFGARHSRPDYILSDSRDKYNGKEEQTTGNLNLLDYGARMYDSEVGRWWSPDPMAEEYLSFSPYNYCANNPIIFIDPNGEAIHFFEIGMYLNLLCGLGSINNDMAFTFGGFELSPYLSKDGSIIGWTAWRDGRVQFLMDKGTDIFGFMKGVGTFAAAADLFYINGTPSKGMVAMMAGDIKKGLGMQWKEALNDPVFVATAALSLANVGISVLDKGNAMSVQNNYNRFQDKIPANSRNSATGKLNNETGKYEFNANSPARDVPGSYANYKKVVGSNGTTLEYYKTTYAPDGSIVHKKYKYKK